MRHWVKNGLQRRFTSNENRSSNRTSTSSTITNFNFAAMSDKITTPYVSDKRLLKITYTRKPPHDSPPPKCTLCFKSFNILTRPHHRCRNCWLYICQSCSLAKGYIHDPESRYDFDPVRICDLCVSMLYVINAPRTKLLDVHLYRIRHFIELYGIKVDSKQFKNDLNTENIIQERDRLAYSVMLAKPLSDSQEEYFRIYLHSIYNGRDRPMETWQEKVFHAQFHEKERYLRERRQMEIEQFKPPSPTNSIITQRPPSEGSSSIQFLSSHHYTLTDQTLVLPPTPPSPMESQHTFSSCENSNQKHDILFMKEVIQLNPKLLNDLFQLITGKDVDFSNPIGDILSNQTINVKFLSMNEIQEIFLNHGISIDVITLLSYKDFVDIIFSIIHELNFHKHLSILPSRSSSRNFLNSTPISLSNEFSLIPDLPNLKSRIRSDSTPTVPIQMNNIKSSISTRSTFSLPPPPRFNLLPQNIESDDSKQICRVCNQDQIQTVFLNCGHACCCVDCSDTLFTPDSTSKCPMCKTLITKVIRIYFP